MRNGIATHLRRSAAIVVAMLATTFIPSQVSSQDRASIIVHVRGEGGVAGLVGASVRLGGLPPAVTGSSGTVRFEALRLQDYTLVVSAVGYRGHQQTLTLGRDTALTVALPIEPIPLNPIQNRVATSRLAVQVFAADSRMTIPDVDVYTAGSKITSDHVGYFRLTLPRHDTVGIRLEAIGYLPRSLALAVSRDSSLRIHLDPDPIGQAMVAAQIKRLDNAANAVPHVVRRVGREEILRHSATSLYEVLRFNGVRIEDITCVITDGRVIHDYRIHKPGVFPPIPSYLQSIAPQLVERTEYLPRGRTLRIYSYRYVRAALPKQISVPPVLDGICG